MQMQVPSLSSSTAGFIDDEIPYFASLLEGTMFEDANSVFTKSRDSLDLYSPERKVSDECNYETKDKGIYPENCLVTGSGIQSGKVGIKNRFNVCTKYAGRSFLSVGIQGIDEDDLLYVTMSYIGDSQYEVVYEVTRAGYFIIFVRYGDWNVADSPFICKVTF
ncbi:uncharacterized protein B4U80_13349 [Leptotrombidium deliense]|uniref:Uncharacterized protein n=1 Tax=Leptotrombidium deliense TaxID=299467 RepID=A0A443S7R5_9ACAR|nr:uncharacterized protein B4U80_13349 [Leptotrombidium deliense]